MGARQEDPKFKACLGHLVRSCLTKSNLKEKKKKEIKGGVGVGMWVSV